MANKSFIVQYLIKARDMFSKNADHASRSMANLDKQNKKTARSGGKLNKTFKITAASLKKIAKIGLTAAVALAGATIFVGAKFETAMADLAAITGATGADLDFLKKKSLELAKTTVTNQAGIAEAMKLVASAKPDLLKDLPALVATTEQVLLLKNAGAELDVAAMAVAGGLNTFGKGAESAAEFVNILAAGSKLGSSEILNTAEAIKIAGPGARAAGLSFLQMNAAIQTVAKGTIFGSQAGTALNAMFGRLRRSGRDFQELGLEGAFQSVKDELNAIKNPTLRAIAEAKIFGEEHSKVGLAILDNIGMLGKFERELKGTNVAQEQAAVRLATFSKQMEKLKIVIQDKLIKLFERIKPLLVENATKLGEWMDKLSEEDITKFANGLMKVLNIIIEIGKGIGQVGMFLFGKSDADKAIEVLKQQGKTAEQIALFRKQVGFGVNEAEVARLAAQYENLPSSTKLTAQLNESSPLKAADQSQLNSRVDVGVNVGLDQGLTQTSKPSVNSINTRRADVGFAY